MKLEILKRLRSDVAAGSAQLTDADNPEYVEVLDEAILALEDARSIFMSGGDQRELHSRLWDRMQTLWFR